MDNVELVRACWAYQVALWGSAPPGSATPLKPGNLPSIPVAVELTVTQDEDGRIHYSAKEK